VRTTRRPDKSATSLRTRGPYTATGHDLARRSTRHCARHTWLVLRLDDAMSIPEACVRIDPGTIHLYPLRLDQPPTAWATSPSTVRTATTLASRAPDRVQLRAGVQETLRRLLTQYLESTDVSIDRTCRICGHPSHGRPTVLSGAKPANLSFSVSYSGAYAAIAISRELQLGVDIEHRSALTDEAIRCALSALSPRPSALLSCTDDPVEAWCRYEALGKATGHGIVEPPGIRSVMVDVRGLSAVALDECGRLWRFITLQGAGDVHIEVCVPDADCSLVIFGAPVSRTADLASILPYAIREKVATEANQ
jgi:phosphopantetheinyl transferase